MHLLALIPSGGSSGIGDLLSALGLQPQDRGKEESLIQKSIPEVAEEVHKRGGLLIGAHAGTSSGVLKELRGQSRSSALQAIDALEYKPDTSQLDSAIDHVRNTLNCNLPIIYGSDNHADPSGAPPMWVKLAERSFNGLRQIQFEPELRVSRSQPADVTHPRIVGLITTGGLFSNVAVRLSPHLNTLIGGRGAGKSALVELLRFAYGDEPAEPSQRRMFAQRISKFLRGTDDVIVRVTGNDGVRYLITRSGAFSKVNSNIEFTEQPDVYQISAEGGVIPRNTTPHEICPIEFFGQGEIQSVALDTKRQLRLIDDNLPLGDTLSAAAGIDTQIVEYENSIRVDESKVSQLRAELSEKPVMEFRLGELTEKLSNPIFTEHSAWETDARYLSDIDAYYFQSLRTLEVGLEPSPSADYAGSPEFTTELTEEAERLARARVEAEQAIESAKNKLEEARKLFHEVRSRWNTAHEAFRQRYRKTLTDLGVQDLAVVSNERSTVQAHLHRITTEIEPQLAAAEARIKSNSKNRRDLLQKLDESRQTLHKTRQAEVERLNQLLPSAITIQYGQSFDIEPFFNLLLNALRGSGAHGQDSLAEQLATGFTPVELAEIVRANDVAKLVDRSISEHNASTVIGALKPIVMKVERCDKPANAVIKLQREGEINYSELHNLSVGEMCSAILSVALIDKARPLIIDQPEDDLDHEFITSSIVEAIRTIKANRQIIAATHNPNIPVIGDAEFVVRVRKQPGQDHCDIEVQGGLELSSVTEQVQLLEGGADAFQRRSLRYRTGY